MFDSIRRIISSVARRLSAGYDAARTTAENREHWAQADGMGPKQANSAGVRRILRNRSRYECQNNTYAQGIVRTLANDVIGTGPRLQMQTSSAEFNSAVEAEFAKWAKATHLARKLRTMREAQSVDGEAFAMFTSNRKLRTRVRLDLRLIEAEQVASPYEDFAPGDVDGIKFDAYGNPDTYQVLREHPGEATFASDLGEAIAVPAEQMIHIFRRSRVGQERGIPETTASLPLFSILRRFTLAVVAAAEAIAEIGTGVIYTDQSAADVAATPYDQIPLKRAMMTALPDGWKMEQLKPEQPTSTYAEFKREILAECSRPWSMPFNIAACNSSGYNYASGRLDHQTYYLMIAVERADIESEALDRIFAEWLDEALVLPGYLPEIGKAEDLSAHGWFWDGSAHVDPSKESTAQAQRLLNLTTHLAAEWASQGKDWETELIQIAKERELLAKLGLSLPTAAPPSEPDPADPADDAEPAKKPAGAAA